MGSEMCIRDRFYWVPAHCGIYHNEKVDNLAKNGAKNSLNATKVDLKRDYHEYCIHLNNIMNNMVLDDLKSSNLFYSRLA